VSGQPGTVELRIKLTQDEYARLTRVAEAHGLERVELLQHLVLLAEECLEDQAKRSAAKALVVVKS
jgi:hypothetical protein